MAEIRNRGVWYYSPTRSLPQVLGGTATLVESLKVRFERFEPEPATYDSHIGGVDDLGVMLSIRED